MAQDHPRWGIFDIAFIEMDQYSWQLALRSMNGNGYHWPYFVYFLHFFPQISIEPDEML